MVAVLFSAVGLLNWSEHAQSPAARSEQTTADSVATPASGIDGIGSATVARQRAHPIHDQRMAVVNRSTARINEQHRSANSSINSGRDQMRPPPHHNAVPQYRDGAPVNYSNDNYSKTGRQPPQPGNGVRSIEDVIASWRAEQTDAEKVTLSQQSILESSPEQTQKINPDEVFNRISAEFKAETNSERQIALLSKTVESGLDQTKSRKLLEEAVNSQQTVDVRRQALYLLTQMDASKAKEIANDPANPLQLDAQAFLLQDQIAAGNPPPPEPDP